MVVTGIPEPAEDAMRILVGYLGTLGFLVKDVTRDGAKRDWSVFPNEESLSGHLSLAFADAEIRGALRRVRRDGRVELSCDDGKGAALLGRLSPAR